MRRTNTVPRWCVRIGRRREGEAVPKDTHMAYKSDTEECRRRAEAWWHRSVLDRVVVQVPAPRKPRAAPSLPETLRSDAEYERYFTDPSFVIPRLRETLAKTWFGGEAFPVIYPVSIGMVAILANYLGCPLRFVSTQTTWHSPVIDDWGRLPALGLNSDNRWWKASLKLLEAAASASDGYYVGCPDLNGPSEILSLMRGHERFAVDFYDNAERIRPALEKITQSWSAAWTACSQIAHRAGGWFFWMGIWSEKPAIDLQSDVSCFVSPAQFVEHFMPSLEEQTRLAERTVYHLDGPGAIRHLDALLDLPGLTGIQWVQGAGGGSVLQYIPLLKRIEASRKLVYCYCEKRELEVLLHELDPEGLQVVVTDCSSPEEGEGILRNASRWTRRRSP
jgi:hypothetical protein